MVENLSKALQHKNMSAAQGQATAELTIKSLQECVQRMNFQISGKSR